jgi:hypothetical protein
MNEGHLADCEALDAFLAQLTWVSGEFEAAPDGAPAAGLTGDLTQAAGARRAARPIRPAFLVHSLLGAGLRAVACERSPRCAGACARPGSCAYGLLMEPRPRPAAPEEERRAPLARVERVPSPVLVRAGWGRWRAEEPLRFQILLLGEAARHRGVVTEALRRALAGGTGSSRLAMRLLRAEWREGGFGKNGERGPTVLEGARGNDGGSSIPGSAPRTGVTLELLTPLRLLREKIELRRFDLPALARNLGFRLAAWGHHHQGLPWPATWRSVLDDAAQTRVAAADVRWVRFRRWSSRQRRAIPMGGLLGRVEIDGATPALVRLLRTAQVCGAGKGPSVGLGRIRLGLESAQPWSANAEIQC